MCVFAKYYCQSCSKFLEVKFFRLCECYEECEQLELISFHHTLCVECIDIQRALELFQDIKL
jgi:hypothetical protein